MAARKVRPAPPKKSRRKPKLDPREKALVEWYFRTFRKGPGAPR